MDFRISLYGYTPDEVASIRTALDAELVEGDTYELRTHSNRVHSYSITYEPSEPARLRALQYYRVLGKRNRSAPRP